MEASRFAVVFVRQEENVSYCGELERIGEAVHQGGRLDSRASARPQLHPLLVHPTLPRLVQH